MKKMILFLISIFVFVSYPSRILCCGFDFDWGINRPSYVDPNIIDIPIFQFEDRANWKSVYGSTDYDGITQKEWVKYLEKYKGENDVSAKRNKNRDLSSILNDYVFHHSEINDYVNFEGDYETALERAADKKLDFFIRAKYAYHSVRIAVLSDKYEEGISNYDRLMRPLPVDLLVRYMAMGYKARALYKLNRIGEAVVLYMDIFDQCPTMRSEARHSMRLICGGGYLDNIIKNTKNDHKKTVALYLRNLLGDRDYSQDTLQQMVQYGPHEVQTEMTLVRMIQDVEADHLVWDWPHLLGQKAFNPGNKIQITPEYRFRDLTRGERNYLPLVSVCEKAAVNPKIRRPALWYWAASYLSLLSGNQKNANSNYEKSLRCGVNDSSLKNQLHLMGTLLEMAKAPNAFTPVMQKRFLIDLIWASSQKWQPTNNNSNDEKSKPSNDILDESLLNLAAQKYIYQKDWMRATLCTSAKTVFGFGGFFSGGVDYDLNISNFMMDMASGEELDQLRKILTQKKDKSSPLDAYIRSKTPLNVQDISFILAVKDAKQFHYDEALKKIKNIALRNPTYLEPSNEKLSWVNWRRFKGSRVLLSKDISYSFNKWKITNNQIKGNISFKEYLEKMKTLQEKIIVGKSKPTIRKIKAEFELGLIYATQSISTWPHLRKPVSSRKNQYFYSSDFLCGYPFRSPDLIEEIRRRYDQFLKETPNCFEVASKHFQSVVDANVDKELSAQSLAFLVQLNYGDHSCYVDKLKADYKDTDFYIKYSPTCSLLNPACEPTSTQYRHPHKRKSLK
jgi:hypothetical protein